MTSTTIRRLVVLLVTVAVLGSAAAGTVLAAAPLTLGFSSDPWLVGGNSSTRAPWIARAVQEGGSVVRVNVNWAEVAPTQRPAGFLGSNPASPGYNWAWLDGVVKDLRSGGLTPCLTLFNAPTWAEAPHRPNTVRDGTWRPGAKMFGRFAAAAAKRYDGKFPDPSAPGSFLPRVRCWQAWDEPNINFYLSPQWVRSGHGFRLVSPRIYRKLLNSLYWSVKRVSHSNFVLMGGTAPFGDTPGTEPPGYERIAPVLFYRSLFCLRGRRALKPYRCPHTYLNGIDHHPFAVAGPTWHALNADDVAVPDVYKIARVLKAAVRSGHVLPKRHKAMWVTELAWSSNPPNPHGVPVATDARWYEQAMYVLWRQGVHTVMSLEIGDPGNITNYSNVFTSGLYYNDGKPKLIATAFHFPFVIQSLGRRRVRVWGRAPQAGTLKIQRRKRGHWRVIRRLSVRRWQVFSVTLRFHGRATWRGRLGSLRSLTWRQGSYKRG